MTDSKTSLAAAEAAIQQAGVAFDSESAALNDALTAVTADRDALSSKVAAQAATILDLQAQLAAAKPDPWAAIDKTGAKDVTDLLQARVTAGDDIPAGTFLVDPTKPIKVTRNGFKMDPNAVLMAKPSPSPRDCILDIAGDALTVTIGQIIGDRMSGAYTPGSTNEWGYGVKVSGDNCTVYGIRVSRCTGDGIGVTGKNCTLHKCVSTGNRRQAISVFNADGFEAYDCEFTDTGALTVDGKTDPAAPNGPCAGIDFEPDASPAGQPAPQVRAHLERCTIARNRAGVLAWLRAEVGGALNITVKNCDIGANANGVQGKALAGKVSMTVTGNRFASNRSSNVRAESGSIITATGNSSTGLASRYALQATGPSPLPPGVIVSSGNTYA